VTRAKRVVRHHRALTLWLEDPTTLIAGPGYVMH
jgi:hypothetical protein